MIISRDYMLKKPEGPSKPKRFLDVHVVPRVANIAGAMEVALDRASVRLGVRPSLLLVCLAGLLSFGLIGFLRGRRRIA